MQSRSREPVLLKAIRFGAAAPTPAAQRSVGSCGEMSFVLSSPVSSTGLALGSCGLEGAELVDLDSLLNSCLEEAQPGVLNFRLVAPFT